jgi:Rrf2 family protein
MVELGEKYGKGYVPLKVIADNQDISQKYLESITADLSKAGLIEGIHGKGGGYKLVKSPADYSVGEILRAAEGSLAPVDCLENGAKCDRADKCATLPLWKELNKVVNDFLDGRTLASLLSFDPSDDYVI